MGSYFVNSTKGIRTRLRNSDFHSLAESGTDHLLVAVDSDIVGRQEGVCSALANQPGLGYVQVMSGACLLQFFERIFRIPQSRAVELTQLRAYKIVDKAIGALFATSLCQCSHNCPEGVCEGLTYDREVRRQNQLRCSKVFGNIRESLIGQQMLFDGGSQFVWGQGEFDADKVLHKRVQELRSAFNEILIILHLQRRCLNADLLLPFDLLGNVRLLDESPL